MHSTYSYPDLIVSMISQFDEEFCYRHLHQLDSWLYFIRAITVAMRIAARRTIQEIRSRIVTSKPTFPAPGIFSRELITKKNKQWAN